MKKMRDRKKAWIVAVAVAILTFGFSTYSRAEDITGFTVCFDETPGLPGNYEQPFWTGFCSAIGKLPIGFPELSFGFRQNDTITANISFDGNGTVEINAQMAAVYYEATGAQNDYAPTSRLVLRARVDSTGKLLGGNGNACPDRAFDDFCVIDGNGAILMRGTLGGATKGFAYKKHAIDHLECVLFAADFSCLQYGPVSYDDFEFLLELTDGTMFNNIFNTYGSKNLVLEGFSNTNFYGAADKFAAGLGFTAPYVFGIAAPTASGATGAILNPCTGQISGSVKDYFSLGAIPGAAVSITGLIGTSATVPAETASWASEPNLCADTYTVSVVPPAGYSTSGAGTVSVALATSSTAVAGVNFKLYSSPIGTSSYMTFIQAAWGITPRNQNAGQLLQSFFGLLYPTGELVIGIPDTANRFSITETGFPAIQEFLPQGGKAAPLTASYVDPAHRLLPKHKGKFPHNRKLGSLAGELLALELNVRFSAYSLTRHGLGELKLTKGLLIGKTVNDVLALGNIALGGGGLPAGFKNYDQLEDIIEKINWNFLAGVIDLGYLKP